VPEKKLTFLPEASAGKTARALTLRDPDEGPLAEQMADIEFRAGNYLEAEQIYRKLFPKSATQPFMGFRIYVCALQRENLAQAADLLPRLGRIGGKTPAPLYAQAALAFKEGRPTEAAEILADAKARFGNQCTTYDDTLRLIGYAP
jgi:Tfp pilus assembly protein PilF